MEMSPVCECPKCHMLGLHLMPLVATFTEQKPGIRIWREEIPMREWYDGRDNTYDKPIIRTHYEHSIMTIEIDKIVRECAFCRHEWYEELRRRKVEGGHPDGTVWV